VKSRFGINLFIWEAITYPMDNKTKIYSVIGALVVFVVLYLFGLSQVKVNAVNFDSWRMSGYADSAWPGMLKSIIRQSSR